MNGPFGIALALWLPFLAAGPDDGLSIRPPRPELVGPYARIQLEVIEIKDGKETDRTGAATFRSLTPATIRVSAEGVMAPQKSGRGTIEVRLGAVAERIDVPVFRGVWTEEVAWHIAANAGRILGNETLRNPNHGFFHLAFVGLLLIAPLCSTIGVQVVNFRLAFFSEAIGHSAFAGIALGLSLTLLPFGVTPTGVMILFGAAVAIVITWYRRNTTLAGDTVVGIFSAAVIAFGLCVISHLKRTGRLNRAFDFEGFITGNILLIDASQLFVLFLFFVAAMGFQFFAYNRLMFIGISSPLAQTLGVRVRAYDYLFAILVALVVMFSVQAVGPLMVTALLVVPAATARNIAQSAGGVFWWGILIAISSSVGGLLISDWVDTTTGATIVLCTIAWFVLSDLFLRLASRIRRR